MKRNYKKMLTVMACLALITTLCFLISACTEVTPTELQPSSSAPVASASSATEHDGNSETEPVSPDASEPVSNPISEPEESISEPEESISEPEESISEPEESISEPEESISEPEEPISEPKEPVSNPKEPTSNPEEPISETEESISVTDTEPVSDPNGLPYDEGHETPENFNLKSDRYGHNALADAQKKAEKTSVRPVFIIVKDTEACVTGINQKELSERVKVWMCDENGNKIDYVYTNKNGIAMFERDKAGTFIFYAEENANRYESTRVTLGFFDEPKPVQPSSIGYYGYYECGDIVMASKSTYHGLNITVVDSETSEPISSVDVEIDFVPLKYVTDENGCCTTEAVARYVKFGAIYQIAFSKNGYDTLDMQMDIATGGNITIKLTKSD